jgi:heparanase 1
VCELANPEPKFSAYPVCLTVDASRPLASVSERYLSFALDTSQLVGGRWWNPAAQQVEAGSGSLPAPVFDFDRPRLDLLVQALAPAYLRLGGSEADKVYYALDAPADAPPAPPPGYESVLTRQQWDSAHAFTRRNGLGLMFTLNAGPAARRRDGAWDPANADTLLAYASRHAQDVEVWQLGNEVNVFFSVHSWRVRISPRQYAADLHTARQLVNRHSPGAQLASQGSAFWPVLGELPFQPLGFMPRSLKLAGSLVDQVVWHYYPQQSRRGPAAVRRATPTRLLNHRYLDEAGRWAEQVLRWRDRYAPGKPVWLGETGNAQFGGEPGVSDRYIAGLWWLDQLGLLARKDHQVVIRQTLCGSDYGLLDDDLTPRPDYWNSLLWKRLMGRQVYPVQVQGENSARLRAYAHSALSGEPGSLAILLINLDQQRPAQVALPQFAGRSASLYRLTTSDVLGKQVWLNGQLLQAGATPPDLPAAELDFPAAQPQITLDVLSYAFIVARAESQGLEFKDKHT